MQEDNKNKTPWVKYLITAVSGLAGAFILSTGQTALAEGCATSTITIENSGNPLPAEVLFACGRMPKDITYFYFYFAFR